MGRGVGSQQCARSERGTNHEPITATLCSRGRGIVSAGRADSARTGDPHAHVIVVITLISYIVINPLHFPPDGVMAYGSAAAFLIAVLSGFFALTRTSPYFDKPWVDLPVFVGVRRDAGMGRDGVLQVRMGVHTGPLVGWVIGSSRLACDYWATR
jgi:hypothetical protein